MSDVVDELMDPLRGVSAGKHEALPLGWSNIEQLDAGEFRRLISALDEHIKTLDANLNPQQWQLVFAALLRRSEKLQVDTENAKIFEEIGRFYRNSAGYSFPRYQLLTCLTTTFNLSALTQFVELMRDDPPMDQVGATTPFLPLMQQYSAEASEALFPALFDCLQHPQLAPAVVDLANFLCRRNRMGEHPGATRKKSLTQLLAGVTRQLEEVQQWTASGSQAETEASTDAVSHAIALAISLCDALALIGDELAKPTLSHAMRLRHRRVQLEAASALARLDDEEGKNAMIQMAAEPSLRLRVLNYAEELGVEDEIEDQFTTGAALGEAELVTFLASPQQYGVAPTRCALIETTTLYWPGYEEPRDCYLFRFAYEAIGEDAQISVLENIGIAGPLTYAIRADITHFANDDIFALFAGWQAEHNQIEQRPIDRDSTLDVTDQQLVAALKEGPYDDVELCLSGRFFDERVVVAKAVKLSQTGLAVSAEDGVLWFVQESELRPLSAEDVFSIYKGRKLLASFNSTP